MIDIICTKYAPAVVCPIIIIIISQWETWNFQLLDLTVFVRKGRAWNI